MDLFEDLQVGHIGPIDVISDSWTVWLLSLKSLIPFTPKSHDAVGSLPFIFCPFHSCFVSTFYPSVYPGSHFACTVSPKTFTGEGLRMCYIPCIRSMQLARGVKCVDISSALGMPFDRGDPGWPSYGKWYNIKSSRPWKRAAWIWTQALWLIGCVPLGNYSPSLSNFCICNMWEVTVLHSSGLSMRWDTVTKVHSIVFGTL